MIDNKIPGMNGTSIAIHLPFSIRFVCESDKNQDFRQINLSKFLGHEKGGFRSRSWIQIKT